jgi:hypothetical protein
MIDRPSRRVLYGLSMPPLAWALQGLSVWFLDWRACPYGSACASPGGPFRGIELAVTFAALAVSVACFVANIRPFARRDEPRAAAEQAIDRPDFMRLAGLIVSMVFSLGIVCAAIPMFFLSACSRVR